MYCVCVPLEKINLDAVIAAIYDLTAKIAKQNEGKVYTRTPMETYPDVDPRDFDDKRDVGLKCYGGIFISGFGTVMDTWISRKGGTVLHAIVKHGQVRVARIDCCCCIFFLERGYVM
jgi:hypothetical protein